jgi:uncharacterized surface protein with fasciclin (FAS1) repeats
LEAYFLEILRYCCIDDPPRSNEPAARSSIFYCCADWLEGKLRKDDAFADGNFVSPASSVSTKKGKSANAPGTKSIAEIAISEGFDQLVGALIYVDDALDAGLVNLFLNGTDQYMVLAPTNKAFEDLYDFLKVDGITDLPAELVLDVLLYHVLIQFLNNAYLSKYLSLHDVFTSCHLTFL